MSDTNIKQPVEEGKTFNLILPIESVMQLEELKKLYRSPSMSHTIRLAIEDMVKIMRKKVAMEEEGEERTLP